MSHITEVLEAIAAIQQPITVGDEQVNAAMPYFELQLSTSDLPACVNQLQGGPVKFSGAPVQSVSEKIVMYLVLQGYYEGQSFAHNEEYVATWRDAVLEAFGAHQRLGGALPYILDATISDWDIEIADLGGSQWWTIRFDLQVRELFLQIIGS